MVQEKVAKAFTLIIVAVAIVLSFFRFPFDSVGIYEDAPLVNRMVYPFFHASVLHAALNCWCLLSIVFIHDISVWRLLLAFVVAASFPADTLSSLYPEALPTVGLSGVCYALLGSLSFSVVRKVYYQVCILAAIGMGFFFPVVNNWLHVYCYLCGLVIAILNKPIGR